MAQLLCRDAPHARRHVLAPAALHLSPFERREELDVEPALLVSEGVLRDRWDMFAGEPLLEAGADQALGDGLLPGREPKRRRDIRVLGGERRERERARLRPQRVEEVGPAADEHQVGEVGLQRLDGSGER